MSETKFLSKTGLEVLVENLKSYIQTHSSDNAVIVKGDVDNSAILNGKYAGYTNKAISKTSMAVGAGTTAGLKGWYYSNIDFTNKKITLSEVQPVLISGSLIGGKWTLGNPNIKRGDKISIVNNKKYDFCAVVTNISTNNIFLDKIPFEEYDTSVTAINRGLDDFSIFLPEKPDAGVIDFGGGAFSEGSLTKATNICAHAEGIETHAFGQYSHSEGRETMAGYAAHAEGKLTNALNEESHAEGLRTTSSGIASHSEGIDSISSNQASHAEGRSTYAEGVNSHAEGLNTFAVGQNSHSEGNNTNALGNHSHAEGSGSIVNSSSVAGHSEGVRCLTYEDAGHSEGYQTLSYGGYSHAQGQSSSNIVDTSVFDFEKELKTIDSIISKWKTNKFCGALGKGTFSSGKDSLAIGEYSTALGVRTYTQGIHSFATGINTSTSNQAEVALGKYNKTTANQIFSIGIGTSESNKKNILDIIGSTVNIYGTLKIQNVEVSTKNDINDLSKTIDKVSDNFTNQMDSITQQIESINTKHQSDIIAINENIDQLSLTHTEDIDTINDNIETINDNIETINDNIETINDNIETINEDIEKINEDIENINEDIETINGDIENIQNKLITEIIDLSKVEDGSFKDKNQFDRLKQYITENKFVQIILRYSTWMPPNDYHNGVPEGYIFTPSSYQMNEDGNITIRVAYTTTQNVNIGDTYVFYPTGYIGKNTKVNYLQHYYCWKASEFDAGSNSNVTLSPYNYLRIYAEYADVFEYNIKLNFESKTLPQVTRNPAPRILNQYAWSVKNSNSRPWSITLPSKTYYLKYDTYDFPTLNDITEFQGGQLLFSTSDKYVEFTLIHDILTITKIL
jgi:methyl-accepting chemotaxis protein